jgi:hypothetical protein
MSTGMCADPALCALFAVVVLTSAGFAFYLVRVQRRLTRLLHLMEYHENWGTRPRIDDTDEDYSRK